jgi:hypothetical protein
MPKAMRIIGTECSYVGSAHKALCGLRVLIRAVHRGDDIFEDDERIGALRATDMIEVVPEIIENGKRRFSWVTSDARLADLKFD